jgi:tyrosine-protein kinase Etk/Wzc
MNTKPNIEERIDLKELFFSVIDHWLLIIICIILSLFTALIYLRITPNTYSVNALVQVEEKRGASAALLGDLSNIVDQKQPAQAEIEILKSRLVLGDVIHHLNLDIAITGDKTSFLDKLINKNQYSTEYNTQSIRFNDDKKSFQIQKFIIPEQYLDHPLKINFKDKFFSLYDMETEKELFKLALNQNHVIRTPEGEWNLSIYTSDEYSSPYFITKKSFPSAINDILNHFSVAEKGKLTGILSLQYTGKNREHITKVLNSILSAYNKQNIDRRTAETAQTLKFLDEKLPILFKELTIAEDQFNNFREKNSTIDITKESELYLTQSIQLDTKLAELQQKVAEASSKYTPDHPVMQQMSAQLTALNQKILELNKILQNLPDLQHQYLQLFREVEVKQQLYTSLLNSSQQLAIAKAGEIGNVRIIDTAITPITPIKPSKFTILALSIFVGAFIGIFIAVLRHFLSSGIKDAQQIEQILDIPVYATVPRSAIQLNSVKLRKNKKNKVIPILAVNNSTDITIESLRSMRTAIHFASKTAKNNIIMISGPAPKVGKSFTSTNLAVILAQSKKRILIIDADMRRGNLDQYFDIVNQSGLAEYLNNQLELDHVIKKTNIENLDLITRGKSPNNPSELLNSNNFKNLLEHFSTQYDYILIDTPPILAVTDGLIISQYVGMNILIARFAKTQIKELEIVINRFQQVDSQVTGIILNDIQQSTLSYNYSYTYHYKNL